jgi:hypothetical protein
MAGMAPVMSFLMMGSDMRAMEPTELLFWGVMSLGVMAGFALAYPSNVWMVARGLKHGLMTDRGDSPQPAHTHQGQHAGHAGSGAAEQGHQHHEVQGQGTAKQSASARAAAEPSQQSHHASHTEHAKEASDADGHAHGSSGIPVTAKIGRHPLHPMLVTLPIGLFVAALLSDFGYWVFGHATWAVASVWLVGAGLAGGLLAAVAGLTDFFGSEAIRQLYHSHRHLICNVAVLNPQFSHGACSAPS